MLRETRAGKKMIEQRHSLTRKEDPVNAWGRNVIEMWAVGVHSIETHRAVGSRLLESLYVSVLKP